MELRQIHYFIAIAEEEHFGRAAQRLRIAQPALSRQMRLLEEELGLQLFDRLPRGVRLSAAGQVFLIELRRVVGELQRAVAVTRRAAAGEAGVLRLSLIESACWHGLVPESLRIFRMRFPAVDLSLTTMSTGPQLAALRQCKTDAALVYNPPPAEDLTTVPLIRYPAVLAMPADCPLAERPRIHLADLASWPLIGFRRAASPRFYDDISVSMHAAGVASRYIAELENETEMLALVSAGAGLAIANSAQRWRPPHGVRFAPVEDLDVGLHLHLLHRLGDVPPTLTQFIQILLAGRKCHDSGQKCNVVDGAF
ncbi:hypothetical protein AQY21_15620 [Paracoccus sp. MKU1]|nr:hypothetical protein AQY21_15620 [Paracoccus sp. MKU1]